LLKHIVKHNVESKSKLFLINVRGDEVAHYKKLHKQSNIILGSSILTLKKVSKKSVVIIEDIITMTKDEEICMRKYLNYFAHHRQLKIFCVCHTVHKTRIYSMLPLFNYIIFTSSSSNIPVIRFTMQYFKIEKDKVLEWMDNYNKLNVRGGLIGDYYFFDCTQMIFYKTKIDFEKAIVVGRLNDDDENRSDSNAPTEAGLVTRFDNFFEGNPLRSSACAIFSIIIKVLPLTTVRDFDLTVNFVAKNGIEKRISLVDYVHSLLTSDKPVTDACLLLHEYVSRRCKIPTFFVVNQQFLRWTENENLPSRGPAFGKIATTNA